MRMRIIVRMIRNREPIESKWLLLESEALLRRRLLAALRSAGWAIRRGKQQLAADLVAEKGPLRYVIEFKVARQGRRRLLRGLLADALLQSQWYASRMDNARPLAVVGSPQLSAALADDLHSYVARFAPGRAYGLVDLEARLDLKGPGLEDVRAEPDLAFPFRLPDQAPPDLFSDRNQWMLKVLLAPLLPSELLRAPREQIRNPAELGKIAQVSVPSAYRLVSRLKEEGFLDPTASSFRLVRVSELLDRWKASNLKPTREIQTRWQIPIGDPQKQLSQALLGYVDKQKHSSRYETAHRRPLQDRSRLRACLGLFSACEALNLGFVHGAPRHLYMERIQPEVLRAFGLRKSNIGEAPDVFVRVPRSPESVFRAAVDRHGLPAADVVQDWLDVANHPVRGSEQAQHLWERVLSPHLERSRTVNGGS